jgi:hypothetical protein
VSDDASALLIEARRLLAKAPGDTAGMWPRAVALLARQSLETALDDFWRWKAPGAQEASRHAQLICIGVFVKDERVAAGIRSAWNELSRACHHHAYELAPTAEELSRMVAGVAGFIQHLRTAEA